MWGLIYVVQQNLKACVNHKPYFRHLTENLPQKPIVQMSEPEMLNANVCPGFWTHFCGTLFSFIKLFGTSDLKHICIYLPVMSISSSKR